MSTRKNIFYVIIISIIGIFIFGCGGEDSGSVNQKTGFTLTLQPSASDIEGVSGFNVEMYNASNTLVDSRYVALESAFLPDGYIPNAGDSHEFSSTFFVLPAGMYHVKAYPMISETELSVVCSMAEGDVVVNPSFNSTLALVSQCVSQNNGGVDIITALNNNPQILDLTYNPSNFVTTCQNTDLTITAQDPEGDALTYNWSVVSAPSGNTYQYSQNFESLTLGDLIGQDSWQTEITTRGTSIVQNGVVISGSQTLKVESTTDIGGFHTYRAVNLNKNGIISFKFIKGNSLQYAALSFTNGGYNGSEPFYLYLPSSGNITIAGSVLGTYVVGTVYSVDIDVDFTNHQVRSRLDGGAWNSWSPFTVNVNSIDTVSVYATGYAISYWDDFTFISNNPYTASASNNVYSFTGYEAGDYTLQCEVCDPFNSCSLIQAPVHVFGTSCQP